jgi:Co/Zn/Cd efflux system component
MRSERAKVQSIAHVERNADPLPESNGQQVSLSSICTPYPDLRLLLIMLLFTIGFTVAEMLQAVMANSISMATDSGTMAAGKYR